MELESPTVTHQNYHFLPSAVALLLGFVLLYILRSNLKTRRKSKETARKCINNSGADGLQLTESDGSADVITVGAGVAGAALACTLAKVRNPNLHLSKRKYETPLLLRFCSDLNCVDGIEAQQVFGYAIYMDDRNTKLSYPLENFESDISGRSFHNGRFIQRMREKAASLPNVKLEQGTVTSLLEEDGTVKGVCYKTKDGHVMAAYAPLTIVCDGCFSNLRRALCKPKVEVPSCFVGLVLENIDLPYANHGHVILADPSPILFYPISNTEVRCLVDVPGQKVPSIVNGEMANYLKTVVAPQPVSSTINTLAGALYKVFCASPDPARKEMRKACFDYLSLGGICSQGPISLLSGLNPRPLVLFLHFFAVAIYGVGRLLIPFPSPKRLWLGARLISVSF
ncbi:hypothetical protein L1987_31946 [Smallanthus sonchifolius]|uniref:Uncharacterized protein n=1 Tax=Smallanthus sonchifolius TaxID=185202 RepID=A0ACB9I6C2_9ASTR|nr:hypothetical protein L1987_31946 [Smallanthus sonchifolius]